MSTTNNMTTPAGDRFPFVKREQLEGEALAIWDKRCKVANTTGLGGHFNAMMHAAPPCPPVHAPGRHFRLLPPPCLSTLSPPTPLPR